MGHATKWVTTEIEKYYNIRLYTYMYELLILSPKVSRWHMCIYVKENRGMIF